MPCQHHEVRDQVVRGDVVGLYGGVVGGPSPVLPPPDFDVALLVLLQNGGEAADHPCHW